MVDGHAESEDETLRDRVEAWLSAEMPVIEMHGGTSAVREADPETGEVVVELGGTCAGCGISDRTARTLRRELIAGVAGVTDVTVRVPSTGDTGSDTVEGGRGGDLQYATDPADHF